MTPIPTDVREVLACPRCHGPLSDVMNARVQAGGAAAALAGAAAALAGVACAPCGVVYPVTDGIPELLAAAAQPFEGKSG